MFHSENSPREAYGMALDVVSQNPGRYSHILLLTKKQGTPLGHATKPAELPLGEGGFTQLLDAPVSLFQLDYAHLTHDGVDHKRVIIWQPLAFGMPPLGGPWRPAPPDPEASAGN